MREFGAVYEEGGEEGREGEEGELAEERRGGESVE